MLEFVEEEHLYLLDGVIIPSVSEILHFIFKNKYANVPKSILNAKANYGTVIHKAIEQYENDQPLPNLNYIQDLNFQQYISLKHTYKIEVLEQEKMVHFKDKYAGRFDMIANIGNNTCLCDIKTTAELDKEYLSWQLSLYEYAYGKKFAKLYAIWLPKKDLGKLVEIKRKTKKEIKDILKKYEERDREREILGI